jgi:hypothetical protein
MLGRASAVTAILLMGAFAGCIGKSDEPTPEEMNETNSANGVLDANESAVAPDGRGELSAFKETNRTEANGTGAMEHKHDYWHGESRRLVTHLASGLIPFPLLPCKEAGTCTAGGSGETYPPGTAIADYDIPRQEGYGLVYEGTAQLELLLNYATGPTQCAEGVCTPPVDHPAVTPNFDYLTAADEPGVFRPGGTLEVGVPFIIPVKPFEADMPHQTKSLWVFRIYSGEPTWWEWNITMTAVKGGEVVDWPPHPDLYAEKSERTIFDAPVHLESKGTVDSNLYGSDAGWVNPERIISWGSQRVEVTVSNVVLTTEAPVPPSGFVLEYHNASKPPLLGHGAQYGGRLVDEGSDGSTYSFVIDITNDHDSYDTPYGEKSRWGFRLVPQFDNGGAACVDDPFLQQLLVGCQVVPWKIDYTMTIKAFGTSMSDPLAGETEA